MIIFLCIKYFLKSEEYLIKFFFLLNGENQNISRKGQIEFSKGLISWTRIIEGDSNHHQSVLSLYQRAAINSPLGFAPLFLMWANYLLWMLVVG